MLRGNTQQLQHGLSFPEVQTFHQRTGRRLHKEKDTTLKDDSHNLNIAIRMNGMETELFRLWQIAPIKKYRMVMVLKEVVVVFFIFWSVTAKTASDRGVKHPNYRLSAF